jgi:hypothetical protein
LVVAVEAEVEADDALFAAAVRSEAVEAASALVDTTSAFVETTSAAVDAASEAAAF